MLRKEALTDLEVLVGLGHEGGELVAGEGAVGVIIAFVEPAGGFPGGFCHLLKILD